MRVRWSTDAGRDRRLRWTVSDVDAEVVVPSEVDGVAVYVTANAARPYCDCGRADDHDCTTATVRVWDATSGHLVRTIAGAGGRLMVATVVGGRPVAVTCDWNETPTVVDLAAGTVLDRLTDHRGHVMSLATVVLPDGPAVVSAGCDGQVLVTQLDFGRVRVIDVGDRLVAAAVVDTPAGAVLAVAGATVGLWSLDRGERIGMLPDATSVRSFATWPGADTLLVTSPFDGEIVVWDVATAGRLPCRLPQRRHTSGIAGVVTGDGRRLLAVGDGEVVHLWDVDADRPAGPPLVGPSGWCAIADAGQGRLVTVSGPDRVLGVWCLDTAVAPAELGHTSTITCLALAGGERVVAGSADGSIRTWSLRDGTPGRKVGRLPAPVHAVTCVEVGAGFGVVAGGGDRNGVEDTALHRWFGDGPDQPVEVGHRGEVCSVRTAVVAGRRVVVSASLEPTVQITDLVTGERVGAIPGSHVVTGLAVGRFNGRPVAAVSRFCGPFLLWDLAAAGPIGTPVTDDMEWTERVAAVVELATGAAIVTVTDGRVRLRMLDTARAWPLDPDSSDTVRAIAVGTANDNRDGNSNGNDNSDGTSDGTSDGNGKRQLVAVARPDATVSLIDLETRMVVETMSLPCEASALHWTADGGLLVACGRTLLRYGR